MLRNSFLRVLLFLLLVVVVSSAGIIHVPGDYSSIQAGLDAAQTADTVLVAPGTYFENLNWPITNGIKLIGEMGPSLTVIDGDSLGRVITIESSIDSSTVITGFIIRNGFGTHGAGIFCSGASPKVINNIITSNHAGPSRSGGGMFVFGSTCVIVEDNQFLYNSAGSSLMDEGGGGLRVWFNNPPEHAVITGNTFMGNSCSYASMSASIGGGMWISWTYSGGPIHISSNEFIGNSASIGGVGPGTGDEVSDYVLYDPWLTELGFEEGIPSVGLALSLSPNPFSVSSTISFEIPFSGSVALQVFDLSGRLIETLVEDDLQEGTHSVALNAHSYCPGIYLIRLQAGSTVQTERCVLLR